MGYDICTRVKPEAYDRMLAFLQKEFRHYAELSGGSADDERYISDVGGGPDCLLGPNEIGFHYNGGWGNGIDGTGFERLYYQTVLNWIALTVGTTIETFEAAAIWDRGPLPFTIYDGREFSPVVVEKPMKKPDLVRYWVDAQGLPACQMMLADRVLPFLRIQLEDQGVWSVLRGHKATRKTFRTELRNLYWNLVEERVAPIRAEIQRLAEAYAALPT